jgi:glycosyltransferase involved in cell wall biosynthesis
MTPNDPFPLVSIGIPTYNRAGRYLRECIKSAINQTYPSIEIIVSDNCSTDGTAALVTIFADPRIRYFRHPKNIGANNNFNFCLEQANGEYFLLLHDDDLIDSDFVDTCMKAVRNQKGISLIRTGTRIIDSNGQTVKEMPNEVIGSSTEDFFLGWFSNKTSLYLCSSLFNTKYLKAIGGFKSRHNLFQDVVAELRLAAAHGRVDIKDVKASFRKHGGELTFAVKVKAWCEDSSELLDLISNLAQKRKNLIRKEGLRFFCRLNFRRAMAIASPIGRFKALLTVLDHFGYTYFAWRPFAVCLCASALEFIGLNRKKA